MSETMKDFTLGSGFQFSGATLETLGATAYTLVTIAVDETGSVLGHEDKLQDMLAVAIEACRKSPYANNLLVRVIRFSSRYGRHGVGGVDEIHGFKPLSDIDVSAYPALSGRGNTPLYDAVYSAVGAANTYAKELVALDFAVNGISFIITDGGENTSTTTGAMVKSELQDAVTGELMESHLGILIGIDTGDASVQQDLDRFQQETGIDRFIWAGAATRGTLAKLALFVSQSVSTTSQALGTGGPSQQIAATI